MVNKRLSIRNFGKRLLKLVLFSYYDFGECQRCSFHLHLVIFQATYDV